MEIEFAIKDISLIHQEMRADRDFNYDIHRKNLRIKQSFTYELTEGDEVIDIVTSCEFAWDREEAETIVLYSISVSSVFLLTNIESYFDEELGIDGAVLTKLLKIGFSHSRGIQSTHVKGTSIERLLVPAGDIDLSEYGISKLDDED